MTCPDCPHRLVEIDGQLVCADRVHCRFPEES